MAESASENDGYIFLWNIENYTMHALSERGCFQSPTFVTAKLNHSKWRLKLYPFETLQGKLGLEIEKVGGMSEIFVEISFYVLTSKGPRLLITIKERKFVSNDTSIVYLEETALKNIFDNGSVFSRNDTLTLKCHLRSSTNFNFPLVTLSLLTQFEVEKYTFSLFFYVYNEGPKLLGKKIIIPKSPTLPHFKVYINRERSSVGFLDVYLYVFNVGSDHSYRVKITTSLINFNNRRLTTVSNSRLFSKDGYMGFTVYKLDSVFRRSAPSLTTFTMDFDLVVSCSKVSSRFNECNHNLDLYGLTVGEEIEEGMISNTENAINFSIKSDTPTTFETGFESLMNDLSVLLSEKIFCDVILKIEETEFRAHKAILSSRSPVFRTMFESDMMEKESGVINISDINPETLDTFLNYLYLGKIDNISQKNAVLLYSAADKYQVMSLRNECSSFILNNLCAENVCDILILSDMHHDEELKNAAIKAFCIYANSYFSPKTGLVFCKTDLN